MDRGDLALMTAFIVLPINEAFERVSASRLGARRYHVCCNFSCHFRPRGCELREVELQLWVLHTFRQASTFSQPALSIRAHLYPWQQPH